MKFTKITFGRSIFIPGLAGDGASTLSNVQGEMTAAGLEFEHGDRITLVPWVHVLTATRQADPCGCMAVHDGPCQPPRIQPPPPPKNKRK
jgi:hypothetical protein